MNGTRTLIKETPESSLTPSATCGHSKEVKSINQKADSQDTDSANALILDFPDSGAVRNKCFLF